MAQVELNRVVFFGKTITKRHCILRTALIDGCILQVVFLALKCSGEKLRTEAELVLQGVAAKPGAGQVRRWRGFVAVLRFTHTQPGAVSVGPIRLPVQAKCIQFVHAQVIDRLGGPVAECVVLGLHVAGQQRGIHAVVTVYLETQTRIEGHTAITVLIGVAQRGGGSAQTLRLRVESVAFFVRQPQGVVKSATGAAETGFKLACVVSAESCSRKGRKTVFTPLGEYLDDAAQRIGAIHGAGRTAQHFNALNQRQRNAFPRCPASGL